MDANLGFSIDIFVECLAPVRQSLSVKFQGFVTRLKTLREELQI